MLLIRSAVLPLPRPPSLIDQPLPTWSLVITLCLCLFWASMECGELPTSGGEYQTKLAGPFNNTGASSAAGATTNSFKRRGTAERLDRHVPTDLHRIRGNPRQNRGFQKRLRTVLILAVRGKQPPHRRDVPRALTLGLTMGKSIWALHSDLLSTSCPFSEATSKRYRTSWYRGPLPQSDREARQGRNDTTREAL